MNTIIATQDLQKIAWPLDLQPREALKMACKTIMEPAYFLTEWPKIESELQGCIFTMWESGGVYTLVIRGLSQQRADIYNDQFARSFCNAIAGGFNLNLRHVVFEAQ